MTGEDVGRCPRCHGPLEAEQVATGDRHTDGRPAGWCDPCTLVVLAPHLVPDPPARADLA